MPFGTQGSLSVSGGLTYLGGWNANTNTPTIVSGVGTSGDYYIVTTAGTTTIDGISSWGVGDWIIFNGTVWQKIDNSDDTSWQLDGNTLTAEKWLGTSSNFDVPMRANNVVGGTVLKTGGFKATKYLISNGVNNVSTNVSIGLSVLDANTTGHNIVAIGNSALTANTTGHSNTAVGYFAMSTNITGIKNAAFGDNAGFSSVGDSNVFIGNESGFYETGSNKLFIDNQARANEADGRAKALVYGVFDAATANQKFIVNGKVGIGTATLNGLLNLASSASSDYFIMSKNSTAQLYFGYTGDGGYLTIRNAADSVNYMNINYTGEGVYDYINTGRNFGIGTTSPMGKFQVNSAAASNFLAVSLSDVVQSYLGYDSAGGYLVLANPTNTVNRVNFGWTGASYDFVNTGRNLAFNATAFGTSAVGVLGIGNGTAPSTSPANMIQAYVVAGVWYYRDEAGNTVTL